jgi:hypothetical protein
MREKRRKTKDTIIGKIIIQIIEELELKIWRIKYAWEHRFSTVPSIQS